MEVRYLNTDFEIESEQDLSIIIEEFGESVSVLHHEEVRGFQHALFEIAGSMSGADEVIDQFCSLVEWLPPKAREVWDGCVSRTVDIGYQSGDAETSFRSELRPNTVKRVAAIGASIMVTIYPLRIDLIEPMA